MPSSVVNSARLDARAGVTAAPAAAVARPLRVCHVMSADLWAGAEVQLATTAAYLAAQPDVSVWTVLFNDGRLARELRAIGVPVTVIDETRIGGLRTLWRLTRLMAGPAFDIVHTHRYKDTILGALAARIAGVPNVVRTVHGLHEAETGWAALRLRAYQTLDAIVLRRAADVVIAVSNQMAAELRRSGYRPGMVTSIHNGIAPAVPSAPDAAARVRRELGLAPHDLVIGTAGRLVPVKGQAALIRALALVRQKRHGVRLLIVGAGPLLETLVETAAGLGLTDACVFAGHRADVHDVVAAMDIFVLPSVSEGIPMALLEAMSMGVPVVATRVGGIPEVVQDRVTGLLVAPGDDHAIADACLELAARRAWAIDLGAAGRRMVRDEYTRERAGRPLLDTYRNLRRLSRSHTIPEAPAAITPAARVFGYPARLAARFAERRRMWRTRRHPEAFTRRLQAARSILVVCHGNIIRSPFAAALLARALAARSSVSVRSAGLAAVPGHPPHPNAAALAAARGTNLASHAATRLTAEAVRSSDVILVMDVAQLARTAADFPGARDRTFLLTCLAPDTPLEVRDPVDGDLPVFERCFDHIRDAVAPLARALTSEGGGT